MSKIDIMALFTVVLEFDGGTYISQFRARSVGRAVAKFASQLVGDKAFCTLEARRRLAEGLSGEKLVAIVGVRNVWCCFVSVGRKGALVNIVTTSDA
jgi:hypothetical protein